MADEHACGSVSHYRTNAIRTTAAGKELGRAPSRPGTLAVRDGNRISARISDTSALLGDDRVRSRMRSAAADSASRSASGLRRRTVDRSLHRRGWDVAVSSR